MAASSPPRKMALLTLPIRLRRDTQDTTLLSTSSTTAVSAPGATSAFIALPAELRLQIYGHIFSGEKARVVYGKGYLCLQDFYPKHLVPYPQLAAATRVCRLIHNEILPVLYEKVEFLFEWDRWLDMPDGPFLPEGPKKKLVTFAMAQHIKHVTLEFKGQQILYSAGRYDFAADTVALLKQLRFGANLQKLGLIFLDNFSADITGLERAASLMHVVICRGPGVETTACRAWSGEWYNVRDHEKPYAGQEYRRLLQHLDA